MKRGEAIQWIRGLVRTSTGKAIQWRGSGHSLNRRTLKTESCCPHPLPENRLLFKQIRGYARKKAFFFFLSVFWIFPVLFRPFGKGRNRQKKADFGRFPGWEARHPLTSICYTPLCGSPNRGNQTPKSLKILRQTSRQFTTCHDNLRHFMTISVSVFHWHKTS